MSDNCHHISPTWETARLREQPEGDHEDLWGIYWSMVQSWSPWSFSSARPSIKFPLGAVVHHHPKGWMDADVMKLHIRELKHKDFSRGHRRPWAVETGTSFTVHDFPWTADVELPAAMQGKLIWWRIETSEGFSCFQRVYRFLSFLLWLIRFPWTLR